MKLKSAADMQKLTPRKKESSWTRNNLQCAERLISEGRMRSAGLYRFRAAIPAPERPKGPVVDLPPHVEEALMADSRAMANYQKLPASQRILCTRWVDSAKKTESKMRRLAQVLSLLGQGKRLGMK